MDAADGGFDGPGIITGVLRRFGPFILGLEILGPKVGAENAHAQLRLLT